MFTIRDIIELAVQIEENGERLYRKAAQEISHPSISPLLLRLAKDEVEHAKWFSQFDSQVDKTIDDPQVEETGKRLLRAVLGDQSFSLKDVSFPSMKGIEDLLKVAIEFQEDTVLFYEMLRSFIDDEKTLDHLQAIIEEENDHIRLLQDSLKRGAVERE